MKNNDHTTVSKKSKTTNQQKKANKQGFIGTKSTSRNDAKQQDARIRMHLTASICTLRLPVLKPKLFIEVQQAINTVDCNAKFIQSIEDVVRCMQFENVGQFKHQSFDENQSISDVLKIVVDNFKQLKHKDSEFHFQQNDNGDWCIHEYRTMGGIYNGCHLPLGLIDEIQKQDIPFSKVLLELFRFLHKTFRFNVMGQHDEYGHNDYVVEHLHEQLTDSDIDQEERNEIKYWIKQHKNGIVVKYTKLLGKKSLTLPEVSAMSSDYLLKKKNIVCFEKFNHWTSRFMHFLQQEGIYPLEQFRYNPNDSEFNDGMPIMFNDLFGFYWNQKDIIFQQIDNYIEMQANESGMVDPSWYRIWDIHNNFGKIEDHDWPITFAKFIEEFNLDIKPLIIEHYGLNKSNY